MVLQFDKLERPIYRGSYNRSDGRKDQWCCNKGHRTPLAAATHAARLMVKEWEDYDQWKSWSV